MANNSGGEGQNRPSGATLQSGGSTEPPTLGVITADKLVEDLLAKRARGDKLTPAEHGKLGAWSAKSGKKLPGRPKVVPSDSMANVPSAGPTMGIAASEHEIARLEAGDPSFIRDTTAAVLGAMESVGVGVLDSEARKAGADAATAKKISGRGYIPEASKRLMIESSPSVLASMGVNPAHYPAAAFAAGLATYLGAIGLAVKELRDMRREFEAKQLAEHRQRDSQAVANKSAGVSNVL